MPVFRLSKKKVSGSSSFETLFAELEEPLLIHAYQITAERELARDIVQEAFVKLHQAGATVKTPKPWLYRTVHNLSINASKRRSKETSLEASANTSAERASDCENGLACVPATEQSLPSEELEHNEMIGLARLMLSQLDERSRSVVHLKFLDGLSYKEIAERVGISVSNVGYLLHQAVSELADEFDRLGLRK